MKMKASPNVYDNSPFSINLQLRKIWSEIIKLASGGGSGGESCKIPVSKWQFDSEAIISSLPNLTPTAILTSTGPGDLQTAINLLDSGDVLEVRTNATYDPIVLQAIGSNYIVKAGSGFTPKISGNQCVKIADGALDITFSGFELVNGSTPAPNDRGACIGFETQGSKCQRIIFANLYLHDVVNGSAVMLCYHMTEGGDNYANPYIASDYSNQIAFIDCNFVRAGKEGIEGANLCMRGFLESYISRCTIDGAGENTRGVALLACARSLVDFCVAHDFPLNGGEGVKIDDFGSAPAAYVSSALVRGCTVYNALEGVDADDNSSVHVLDCIIHDCADEGVSIDNNGDATIECCKIYDCNDGIRVEDGARYRLIRNNVYNNTNSNFRMDGATDLPDGDNYQWEPNS